MNGSERFSAGAEPRRTALGRTSRPGETQGDQLTRYIAAVASVSAKHVAVPPPPAQAAEPMQAAPAESAAAPAEPAAGTSETGGGPQPLLVREVMDVPAASVPEDMPFLDIARTLARDHIGCLPVVDAEDHVLGVVSESDLLAKAAIEASGHHPGVLARLRERRLHDKARGETAESLMTSPAVTVFPRQTVAQAAWLVCLSRLKRLPVTDHFGRLVGVVHRNALLAALIRDDAQIREEIVTKILTAYFPADRDTVKVTVRNGVVELDGKMRQSDVPLLLARIKDIDDVTEVRYHLAGA
ncbi:CBS domain-containing protein [Streptomyces sp. KLOTTS4A1]|uniref:CBS domain-containing protein n=1 Tax=Streptomyces sp. KLOTTS4A1 TaxID=3390996 RepID=UPI0039F44C8D